jgi:hypothetical protein
MDHSAFTLFAADEQPFSKDNLPPGIKPEDLNNYKGKIFVCNWCTPAHQITIEGEVPESVLVHLPEHLLTKKVSPEFHKALTDSKVWLNHAPCEQALDKVKEEVMKNNTSLKTMIRAKLSVSADDEMVRSKILELQRQKDEILRRPDFPHKSEMLQNIDKQIASLRADQPDQQEMQQAPQAQEKQAPIKLEPTHGPGQVETPLSVNDGTSVYPGKGMAAITWPMAVAPASKNNDLERIAQENTMEDAENRVKEFKNGVIAARPSAPEDVINEVVGDFELLAKDPLNEVSDEMMEEALLRAQAFIDSHPKKSPESTVKILGEEENVGAKDIPQAAPQDATKQPEFGTTNYSGLNSSMTKKAAGPVHQVGDPVTIKETGRVTEVLKNSLNGDPDWYLVADEGNPVGLEYNIMELEAAPETGAENIKARVMEKMEPKKETLNLTDLDTTKSLFSGTPMEHTEGKTYGEE